jgi:tol-pal system protein YbgF
MLVRRPLLRPAFLCSLLAILASGCVSDTDLSALRKEQRDLARRLADTRADVETLRVQMSRLRGEVEEGGSHGRAAAPPPSSDIEERLRVLESNQTTHPTEPSQAQPGSVPPGSDYGGPPPSQPQPAAPAAAQPPAAPAGDNGAPVAVETDLGRSTSDEYRNGLTQYQRGESQKAVQTLRSLVNKNPKSDVVPYAQYWIGEAYYTQGKYNEAILAYNEVLVGSPKSDRVPAALLRQASAFAELGDKIDARLILQKLIQEHPNTPEAARGKRDLMALAG